MTSQQFGGLLLLLMEQWISPRNRAVLLPRGPRSTHLRVEWRSSANLTDSGEVSDFGICSLESNSSLDTVYSLGPAILRVIGRHYAVYLGPPFRWRRVRVSEHQPAEFDRKIRRRCHTWELSTILSPRQTS